MKIWRLWCSRYLCNHGFLLCEKFECPKFRYHTEVIYKKTFFSVFLKCTIIVSDIYEHVPFQLYLHLDRVPHIFYFSLFGKKTHQIFWTIFDRYYPAPPTLTKAMYLLWLKLNFDMLKNLWLFFALFGH